VEIFRKKSIQEMIQTTQQGTTLRKELNAVDLAMLGVGAIIGTGIFVLTGLGSLVTGPALPLSFIIAGFTCLLAAFTYAEFASLVPVSGSTYTYSYATLGEFFAWVIGWDLILEYLLAVSSVSVGWSGYFQSLLAGFGIQIPHVLTQSPLIDGTSIMNLPAFLIILFITWLLSIGVKESKRVNNIMVLIKVAVILLFILVGAFYVKPENWTPFMPFGIKGVFQGAALIFFAYLGFDAVSTAAEETKNPAKDLPKGILWSLGVVTLLYMVVSALMTGIVPFQQFEKHADAPVAYAISITGQDWLVGIVSLGAAIGMITVMLVMLYGQIRIIFAMSRDGLMPKFLSKVHKKYRTPYVSTWTLGLIAAFLGAFVPLDQLAELVNLGTLAAFVLISVAVIVLRYKQPDLPRKFKTPLVPYVPVLAIIFCCVLAFNLEVMTWVRFLIWFAVGLLFYLVYGYEHSNLRKKSNSNSE
jgi:basic amino acid/polyamine antiporter, APA family